MFDAPNRTNVRPICVSFLCLLICTQACAQHAPAIGSSLNWITLWLSFFFGVLFTMLFRHLNKRKKQTYQRSNAGQPMTAIVIFLGFNLVVRLLIQIYFFWEADFLSRSTWLHLFQLGGLRFQSVFLFEMFLSLFALAATGALLYWFVGKRDIFPIMFIYYVAFYFLSNLMRVIIYHTVALPPEMASIRHDAFLQVLRILYGAAWIIFVWKAKAVKQTFVYPPETMG